MESIDEEARDLVELEDVSESEHTIDSTERTDEANEDNPDRRTTLKRLLYRTFYWIECL